MKTWKKVGLTALAGSLMAVSAQADWSVSGSGILTYTDGANATNNNIDGDRFGMAQDFSVSASVELDNGFTVKSTHAISAGAQDASTLSIDMGSMGSLSYVTHDGTIGLESIDDMTPTAHEEVWNGVGKTGGIGAGKAGWNYTNTVADGMATIGLGLVSKAGTAAAGNGTGATSTASTLTDAAGKTASGASMPSMYIKLAPMDGLAIGYGSGEYQDAAGSSATDDHSTMYATYAYGPVTVGYQASEVDDTNSANVDIDTTAYSIVYAVNDEMSISYGETEADYSTTSINEEIKGFSASYTMGAMTVSLHSNEKKNAAGATAAKVEHTELAVKFAF